jgi:hypothetical protein
MRAHSPVIGQYYGNFIPAGITSRWRGSPATPMPHGKKKLSTCDRTAIRTWIREGAKNN